MTSLVFMVSMGIMTVTLAAAATAPNTNDTCMKKKGKQFLINFLKDRIYFSTIMKIKKYEICVIK